MEETANMCSLDNNHSNQVEVVGVTKTVMSLTVLLLRVHITQFLCECTLPSALV